MACEDAAAERRAMLTGRFLQLADKLTGARFQNKHLKWKQRWGSVWTSAAVLLLLFYQAAVLP